jgi:bifunctional oligoribonuclease and PAP phosphatase NrnA
VDNLDSKNKEAAQLDYQAFVAALKPYKNIALTAPAGADGDSVGTQCALKEMLEVLLPHAKIRIVNEEPCPQRYLFLKGSESFEVSAEILKGSKDLYPEVMICVDGGFARVGTETTKLWNLAKLKVQVDHHMIGGANDYGFRLYDPEAAATTEIVFRMQQALHLPLTQTLAQAIYVGLIFDTGLFKHSNTRPETLEIAATLLNTKFPHTETVEKAMLIRSHGAFQMLKHILSQAHFECGGKYVWTVMDFQTFMDAGGDADDREGLIDQIFLTQNCIVAAFYFERHPNEWKMSFRSRGPNVAQLAQKLNPQGGGHILAAGCTLHGSQKQVLELCHEALRKLFNA